MSTPEGFDTNVDNFSNSYNDDRAAKRRKFSHVTFHGYNEANLRSSHSAHLNPNHDSLEPDCYYTTVAHHDNAQDQYCPSEPARWQQTSYHDASRFIPTEDIPYSQSAIIHVQTERCEDYNFSGTVQEPLPNVDTVAYNEHDRSNVVDDDDKYVCYGMLCNINVEGCGDGMLGRYAVVRSEGSSLQRADNGDVAGQLSRRTESVLDVLVDNAGVQCQLWLHYNSQEVHSLPKSIHASNKRSPETINQNTLSAILYGPESLAEVLGDWLNEVGMFLQQPEDCDCDVPYKNPHCLSFGQVPSIMTNAFTATDSHTQSKEGAKSAGDLAELYTDEVYPEASQPSLIQSPLHSHQKQALAFMLHREKGWCYDGSRPDVWRHSADAFGRIRFKNTISGHIQKQPPKDFRGGILADDMGLGKTCTMLSLIAADSATSISHSVLPQAGSSLGSSPATLVVVPFSLLQVWERQILLHFQPGKIRCLMYHNIAKQVRAGLKFNEFDIVISTYNTVASERKHCRRDALQDGLFSIHWRRLILDEAHMIRTWTTANAKAVCDLEADCRWAVTGTPIQNRLSDIYSILKFLRVCPYENLKAFDDEILKPWKFHADQSALHKLQYLMKSIAIRRPKKIVSLPQLQPTVRYLELNSSERTVYGSVRDNTIEAINSAISQEQQSGVSFINAFQKLNDLRYICNHGRAPNKRRVETSSARGSTSKNLVLVEELDVLLGDTGVTCVHCGIDIQDQQEEYQSLLQNPFSSGNRSLEICRSCEAEAGYTLETVSGRSPTPSPHSVDSGIPSSPSSAGTVYSSKVTAIVDEVQTLPDNDKCVVFSYWTSTLEVIGRALKDVGIMACQFDGRLSRVRRNHILQCFSTDANIRVLLVSITCGGAGLDLTSANHAFLVEPQWNPQLEEQAMARVHRLGQTKPVRLIRFIVRDTWEEKIRHLQERKRSVADLIVDRKSIQDGDAGRKQLYYLRELLSNK